MKKLTLKKMEVNKMSNEEAGKVKGGFTYSLSLGSLCRKSNRGFGGGGQGTTRCP